MSSSFMPIEEVEIYCRFCNKITQAHLDRSIAENGRTVDRNSTFEYLCSKCLKTFCFSGQDLIEQSKDENKSEQSLHEYSPADHFLIGEKIYHKKWKDTGMVIGKEKGTQKSIIVNFEKTGLKKLIEDFG